MKKTFILILFLVTSLHALRNPSAVYCEAMGHDFLIESDPSGSQSGYCMIDGNKADAWKFLFGEEGQDSGYCAQQGYGMKTVNDSEKCVIFLSDHCAVCVLPDGSETEVTALMGLSFKETVCGDGVCGIPERPDSCPKDCPSGISDDYCDSVIDDICDPDCDGGMDKDCVQIAEEPEFDFVPVGIGILALSAILIVIFARKR